MVELDKSNKETKQTNKIIDRVEYRPKLSFDTGLLGRVSEH